MNSAFVVYEELSRSIRVTKTSEMFAIFFSQPNQLNLVPMSSR